MTSPADTMNTHMPQKLAFLAAIEADKSTNHPTGLSSKLTAYDLHLQDVCSAVSVVFCPTEKPLVP